MRIPRLLFMPALALLGGLLWPGAAAAQEPVKQVPGFDPDRAILNDSQWFDPFRVTDFESLAEALDDGKVAEETPLLVLKRRDAHLALLTMQMTYHHIAQGELEGEPWMVAF